MKQSLDNKILEIMSDNDCPPRFWDYAIKYASYLHNIYPRPTNPNGMSPHEMVTNIKPDY